MTSIPVVTPRRYRIFSARFLGELLTKSWIDSVIPAAVLLVMVIIISILIPGFFSLGSLSDQSRQLSEFGLLAIALTIVLLSGGIDLSIGSMFALCVLVALTMMNVLGVSIYLAFGATLLAGFLCGALNGILIGYIGLRAFITTLVTLVIFRSIYDIAFPRLASGIVGGFAESALWDFIGFGEYMNLPVSFLIFAVIAFFAHIMLTRLRIGWHIRAVGGSRKSAHNSGIHVKRTVAIAYICSGLLTATAAFLFSARLGSTGSDTGIGLEVQVLTAVVLAGVSLGGGRGSVGNALIGAALVLILTNALIRFSVPGNVNQLVLGLVLIIAVIFDAKWVKNRQKILGKVYVSPTYMALDKAPAITDGSVFAVNDLLGDAEIIGQGTVEGPEDVILDRQGNLYTGTRHGEIVRFFAPDFARHEVFAQIGGHPLGLAFDGSGNLLTCVGGMGVYRVSPDGVVSKVTDETDRSLTSIIDDSRLRLPDDLDIAPDGRIFFTEATKRYEMTEWAVDALEGRGNGRLLEYDPKSGKTRTVLKNLIFPNGVTICPDGDSLLFAETWACRINRYWFAGPRKGRREIFLDNLPGYPDNINRASDGGYWIALLGMRTPAFDLTMQHPSFRRRMAVRIPADQWLFPNINKGCVIKVNADGKVTQSLWEAAGEQLPSVTSMREHRGWLYLGGVTNNRIGRIRLAEADENWDANTAYWGPSS